VPEQPQARKEQESFLRWFQAGSMDWFKGKFTGKPHISWENLWFPVKIFP